VRICAIIVSLLAVVGTQPLHAAIETAGDVTAQRPIAQGVEFTLSSGAIARVQAVTPDTLRVQLAPTNLDLRPDSVATLPESLTPTAVNIVQLPGAVGVVTLSFRALVILAPFRVLVFDTNNQLITADAESAYVFDRSTGLVLNARFAPQDEAYFGFGERGGPINRRGRTIYMRNTDEFAWSEYTDPLYQSYPFYYGVRNGRAYGVFLDANAYSFFGMDPNNVGAGFFGAEQGDLEYYIFTGPTPSEVAQQYAHLTGASALPPLWSIAYHHSHFGWKTGDEILAVAQGFRDRNIPLDAIWFDIDHMDRFHHFTWDMAGFPDPVGLHQALDALHVRKVYINEPCVVTGDPLWPYLDALGFFLKDGAGVSVVNSIFLGDISWLDFSKTAVSDWYKQQLKIWLSLGIDGMWNDLNEPAANNMPEAVHDFDGFPVREQRARNIYALLENRMAYEAQRELRPNTRPWNFSRSGFSGVQRYAATWSGDPLSDFESMRVAIQMSISMGLSGVAQFGHDTGGFLGSPDAELYLRWLAFSCYSPLMRTHSTDTSAPREPWSFGEPTTSMIRSRIEERYRLLPYLYTLYATAASAGQPVLAPTMFYFPNDAKTFAQDSAFMLGPDLLVAPVFVRGATTRDVYLPMGVKWIDTQSDAVFTGGQVVTLPAPIDVIPTLAREGAITVHGPIREHTRDGAEPDRYVDIYGGEQGSFTLYEDDGETFDYTRGVFLHTRIEHARSGAMTLATVTRQDGLFEPGPRDWWITLHKVTTPPIDIALNGVSIPNVVNLGAAGAPKPAWSYDAGKAILKIRAAEVPTGLTFEIR